VIRIHQHIREASQKFDKASRVSSWWTWVGWLMASWSQGDDMRARDIQEQAHALQATFARTLLLDFVSTDDTNVDAHYGDVASPPDRRFIEQNVDIEENCI
jgi:hypothetical protein